MRTSTLTSPLAPPLRVTQLSTTYGEHLQGFVVQLRLSKMTDRIDRVSVT